MFIFGYFLIVYLIFLFNKYSFSPKFIMSLVALTACLEIFVNVGYFVKISFYEFKYSEFIYLLLFMSVFVHYINNKIDIKYIKFLLIFIGFIIINNLLIVIYPYAEPIITFEGQARWWDYILKGEGEFVNFTFQTIMMDFRYIMFMVILFYVVSNNNNDNNMFIINKFFMYSKIIMMYIVLELIFIYAGNVNVLYDLRNNIFGIASSTAGLFTRGSATALSALTLEPGHIAKALWVLLLVYILTKEKLNYSYIALVFIYLLLSTSFAGLLYIASLVFILFIKERNKYLKFAIILFITISISIILIYYQGLVYYNFQRFISVYNLFRYLDIDDATGSEIERLMSNAVLLKVFLSRPFFGVGIGTVYSYSALISLLATVGMIGVSLLFYLYAMLLEKFVNKKTIITITILLFVLLLTGSIGFFYSIHILLIIIAINISDKNINYIG